MKGRPQGSKNKALHIWTPEEKEYLKQITPGHHHIEILEKFNKKFGLNFSLGQIKGAINRYNLNTGFTGQFEKEHIPANKGVKGVIYEGCKKTWFKKGDKPINHRDIGSERINVDGYVEIKVAEPSKWRLKHQVVWETHKGIIPKGHVVIFGDGNKLNLDIDNLVLVSKKQLAVLNKHKLIKNDADLTRTGIIIADVYLKIGEIKAK